MVNTYIFIEIVYPALILGTALLFMCTNAHTKFAWVLYYYGFILYWITMAINALIIISMIFIAFHVNTIVEFAA